MTPDKPGHNNAVTTLEEPVYLFKDKAIVPPRKPKRTPSDSGESQAEPPPPAPKEESSQ
jgi:hypothetical protein